MEFEIEMLVSEALGLTLVAAMSVVLALIKLGCRISSIERIRLFNFSRKRKGFVNFSIQSLRHENPPYGRVATTLAIFCILLYLTLSHKLFFAVVVSDSMYPTFQRGDMYLAQAIQINPKPGDIIMFRRPDVGLPVSHRVLRVVGNKIYTGGDASGPDLIPITRKDVIAQAVMIGGKPIVIPGIGKYFILNAKQLRNIGPYGEEYLFYQKLIRAFKSYAMAIIVICLSIYVYLELEGYSYRKRIKK